MMMSFSFVFSPLRCRNAGGGVGGRRGRRKSREAKALSFTFSLVDWIWLKSNWISGIWKKGRVWGETRLEWLDMNINWKLLTPGTWRRSSLEHTSFRITCHVSLPPNTRFLTSFTIQETRVRTGPPFVIIPSFLNLGLILKVVIMVAVKDAPAGRKTLFGFRILEKPL